MLDIYFQGHFSIENEGMIFGGFQMLKQHFIHSASIILYVAMQRLNFFNFYFQVNF